MSMIFAAHFCRGKLPVAFVFSAPGAEEVRCGKPVAGDTGDNLDAALPLLHAALPAVFSSILRYDYRITNASAEPLAASLGHKLSEAKNAAIRTPTNIGRVLSELESCSTVILCGKKAKLLLKEVRDTGKAVIVVPHVGNKGLNGTFRSSALKRIRLAPDRRKQRVNLWSNAVIHALMEADDAV